MTGFIMLIPGRTGSSYLTEKLSAHPHIHMRGEILDPFLEELPDVAAVNRKQVRRVVELYRAEYPPHIQAVGFKTKIFPDAWTADGLCGLREALVSHKVIFLLRRNLVKAAVSSFLAKRLYASSGRWNVRDSGERMAMSRIEVGELEAEMLERQHLLGSITDFGARLAGPKLHVYYEDILQNEEREFERICEFLAVPYVRTESTLIKHTDNDLSRVIANFAELMEHYRESPYAAMLAEI